MVSPWTGAVAWGRCAGWGKPTWRPVGVMSSGLLPKITGKLGWFTLHRFDTYNEIRRVREVVRGLPGVVNRKRVR